MTKIIRNVRYQAKPNALFLLIDINEDKPIRLEINNCSISGISAKVDESKIVANCFGSLGDILNESNIVTKKEEIPIGRLVLRGMDRNGRHYQLRFSLIDTKLPIDGKLSHFLIIDKSINPFDIEIDPYKFDIGTFINAGLDSKSLFSKCYSFSKYHEKWQQTPLYGYNFVRLPSQGTRVKLAIKGAKQNRNDFLDFASNDYLNMSTHRKVKESAISAINDYGFGSTGSPLITGLTSIHDELANYVAKLLRKEKCLLFNSGYAVNAGAIPALTRDTDLIYADILSHASINHGIESSKARARYFKHNNMNHLEKSLRIREEYAGCLIITEGIFSMNGDVPDLTKMVRIAKKNDAKIFLDEAHSFGIIGPNYVGAADHFNVLDDVDIIGGTFSKIAGSAGGFIAADAEVIDWLNFFAKSHMFSVSMPAASAAAALTALQVVFEEEPDRITNLHKNVTHFIAGLKELGEPYLRHDHLSGIVTITIGDEKKLAIINEYFVENHIRVVPIVYPAVPRGKSRFRFCITSEHSITDLDYAIHILDSGLKKAKFKFEAHQPDDKNEVSPNIFELQKYKVI